MTDLERIGQRLVTGFPGKVAADGLPVEVEIIEVQAEQDITLLDVARTQDTVPRPILVDGAFAGGNGIGALQNLVHIAVVLDEDTAFRIFRQVHPFDNVPPAFTLFRIIQVGDAAYTGIFIGILPGNDFKETESGFEATHAGVVGIPVIVYVVFVFIGSGNSQNDVFLLGLRERHPLAPEAADTASSLSSSSNMENSTGKVPAA